MAVSTKLQIVDSHQLECPTKIGPFWDYILHLIKHDNQKLRPNTEDYHFEAEKIHGSEIKEISSQQKLIMYCIPYNFCGLSN